jgi:hypothetical protein
MPLFPPNYPISLGTTIKIPVSFIAPDIGTWEGWYYLTTFPNGKDGQLVANDIVLGSNSQIPPDPPYPAHWHHNLSVDLDTLNGIYTITQHTDNIVKTNPLSGSRAIHFWIPTLTPNRNDWVSADTTTCDPAMPVASNVVISIIDKYTISLDWNLAVTGITAQHIWREYPALSGNWTYITEVSNITVNAIIGESQQIPMPKYAIVTIGIFGGVATASMLAMNPLPPIPISVGQKTALRYPRIRR